MRTSNKPFSLVSFAQMMTRKMQDNVLDAGWKEWIMPNFTTTTDTDKVVASVMFMGTIRKHFGYIERTGCGIPTVTLMYVCCLQL